MGVQLERKEICPDIKSNSIGILKIPGQLSLLHPKSDLPESCTNCVCPLSFHADTASKVLTSTRTT